MRRQDTKRYIYLLPKPPENQQNCIGMILCSLVREGHLGVLNKLLDIPFVSQVASGHSNYIFRLASCYGNVHVIERLLKIDKIYFKEYANSNEALPENFWPC